MLDGRRSGGVPDTLVTALPLIVAAAASLLLSSRIGGPTIHADEGGYLVGGAALSGVLTATPASGYYAGYSLLLVPAYRIADATSDYYRLALVTNAVLLVLGTWAIAAAVRVLFPTLGRWTRVGPAVVFALHPALLGYSQVAMAETASTTCIALAVCGLAKGIDRRSWGWCAVAGAASAYLYLINPRGAVMAGGIVVTILIALGKSWLGRRHVASFGVALVVVVVAHWPLEKEALRQPTRAGSPYDLRAFLKAIASPGNWPEIIRNASGGTSTALLATCGLPLLWMFAIARRRRELDAADAIGVGLLVSAAGSIFVAAGFFSTRETSVSYTVYERYFAPVLVPLLAVTVAALLARRFAVGWGGIAVTLMVFIAGLGIARLLVSDALRVSAFHSLNAPSWFVFRTWSGRFGYVRSGKYALGFLALVLIGFRLRPRVTCVALAVALAAATGYMGRTYFAASDERVATQREVYPLFESLGSSSGGVPCIEGFIGLKPWNFVDSRFYLLEHSIFWDHDEACGPALYVASEGAAAERGLVAVGCDADDDIGVYVEAADAGSLTNDDPNAAAWLDQCDRAAGG